MWTDYKHPVKFEYLSVEHGLSQSSVLCILQDSKGFMWFGTEDGLNKYDGYGFETFKPEPGNPDTINSSVIWCLHEDRQGTLWIGTNGGGLNRFDHKKEKFVHYMADPNNPNSLNSSDIRCIFEDKDGTLWLGTTGGLNKMISPAKPGETPDFVSYSHDPQDPQSLSGVQVSCIFRDSRGVLWVGTDNNGLNKMIPTQNRDGSPRFVHYRSNPRQPHTAALDHVLCINEDYPGTLWVGTTNGLYAFKRQDETFTCFRNNPLDPRSLSHNLIRLIFKDRAGMLWVGTDGGGVNKMIPGDMEEDPITFTNYKHDSNNPCCLSNDAVESMYEDRSGVLWIGVYNGGLNKLILRDTRGLEREYQQFVHYQTIPNNPDSLSHNHVNAIHETPEGVLWVGTDGGGLNKITPGPHADSYLKFSHYKHNPQDPDSLSDNIVTAILVDHGGVLWVGTYTGGLDKKLPGPGGGFAHHRNEPRNPGSLASNFVRIIYEDRRHRLWIGTMDGGLEQLDRNTGAFSHFRNEGGNPHSLTDDNVFALYEDRFHRLWVGTVSGLNVAGLPFNPGGNLKFTRFQHQPDNPHSLSCNFVRVIFEDSRGSVWIGTNGGGLNKITRLPGHGQTPAFTRYGKKNGLPNNAVLGILEDNDGYLWLSTNKGLSRFNPGTGEFRNFDSGDGLQGSQFNGGACFKSRTGEMFFGGNNGFNVFHPYNIRDNTHIPSVVITRFRLFNRPVPIGPWTDGRTILTESITETGEIELSHRDAVISFEFAALHYVNPSKNRYAYIMEGLEENWNHVSSRRFVSYTTLPPGDYVFRVKASNNDGTWNERGVKLKIHVSPPFWKTWWFIGMVSLLVIFAILGVHQYRVRHIIKQVEKKYQKTAIKPEKAEAYLRTLLDFMKQEKPYLDPEFTLHKLSDKIGIPYHCLSQVINGHLNKIFFDFINEYRIDDAVNQLTHTPDHQKNIQEIAHAVGFHSQSAFNRAFKKHTQHTPSDYLVNHRVREAVKKLSDPTSNHLTIPQIAKAVGFSTQSSFNRAFKKVTGKTPSQYRNAG